MTIIDSQLETTASRNDAVIENSTANNYVTVSVSRDVVAGREADYEAWISEITTESSRFSGHLGVNVIRPSLGSRRYTIIYRFDNMDHAKAWQHSSQRQMWMEKIDGMIEGEKVRSQWSNYLDSKGEDGALNVRAIADAFFALHEQHRTAWTQELDIRPYKEEF